MGYLSEKWKNDILSDNSNRKVFRICQSCAYACYNWDAEYCGAYGRDTVLKLQAEDSPFVPPAPWTPPLSENKPEEIKDGAPCAYYKEKDQL